MISRSPADSINARLDRLPSSHTIWLMIVMLALGGWFEYYDMLFTAYIGPGLVKSSLLLPHTSLGSMGWLPLLQPRLVVC
jgi:hypothetical protein